MQEHGVSSIHTCNRIAGSVHGVHFGYVGLAGSATCSLSIFLRNEEYAGVRRACNWTLSRVHGGGGNKEEEGRVTRRRSQVPEGRGTGRTEEVGYTLKQSGKEAVTPDNPHETPALRQTQDAVTTNFVDTCRRRVVEGQPSTAQAETCPLRLPPLLPPPLLPNKQKRMSRPSTI